MIHTITIEGRKSGVGRVMEDMKSLGLSEHITIKKGAEVTIPKDADVLIIPPSWNDIAFIKAIRPSVNKLVVMWTSPPLQMQLCGSKADAYEIRIWTQWLKLLDYVDYVWCASPDLPEVYKNDKIFYAPLPYDSRTVKAKPKKMEERDGVSITCPPHPRKNLYPQLLAIKILNKKLKTTELVGVYGEIAKSLDIEIDDRGYLVNRRYWDFISSAEIAFQVFLSESFCATAWEHMLLDVPIVGSSTLRWLPEDYICDNFGSPVAIAEKAKEVLEDYKEGVARGIAIEVATKNVKEFKKIFKEREIL